MTILDVMDNPRLFGPWFRKGILGGDTYALWRVFLCAAFCLPMTEAQQEAFRKYTGRTEIPKRPFGEILALIGRRGGKSLFAALIIVYLACFRDYSAYSVPGETLCAMLLAADKKQAGILLRYIGSFFDKIPVLSQMVESRTAESITLKSGIEIRVTTSDFRAVRGYTLITGAGDEAAFWDGNDAETLNALRPAMSTIPGALLLITSSPYARKGIVWDTYREHYGKNDSPVLVWQAASRTMNPSISRAVIAAAYMRDAASARAEFGAEFRSDIESFVPVEALEQCTVTGRLELPRIPGKTYHAFVDPSGGSSDSFTLAIAHAEEDGTVILDCVREITAPFSPAAATAELATTIKSYGLSETTGDAYSGEYAREEFAKNNIAYRVSELSRSQLYLELLPGLMSARIRLLDNKKLIAQLQGLERRTARTGKDSIDHAPGQHDDLCNSAAGACWLAMGAAGGVLGVMLYEQLEAAGKLDTLQAPAWNKQFLYEFEEKLRGLTPPAPEERWKEPVLPGCPKCKATIVTKLSGVELRCAECGLQFFVEGYKPAAPRGQRGEWLAGRLQGAREVPSIVERFTGRRQQR